MAEVDQAKAGTRLAALRERRNQNVASGDNAAGEGQGEQKGERLRKFLAQRRQEDGGNAAGQGQGQRLGLGQGQGRQGQGQGQGAGQGQGRIRKGLIRKALADGDHPKLKAFLQERGGRKEQAADTPKEPLSEEGKQKLKARLESRKQKLEERIAQLDDDTASEVTAESAPATPKAPAKRAAASVSAGSKTTATRSRKTK